MNKALATVDPSAVERVAALSTEELRAELAASLGMTARHLCYLAAVWRELERRGEDLSDLRSGLAVYLPAIAAGTVLPETVIRFAGRPVLLRAVALLTPEEQRRLVEGEPVAVAERTAEGYTTRRLPAHALSAAQVRLVFGERSVRSESEQIATLSSPPPKRQAHRPIRRGKVEVDVTAATVRVGRSTAPLADVVRALAEAGVVEPLRKK